jgi:DNA modification methylase
MDIMKYTLFQGDCLDFLVTLETESVDSVVTDPPAGIAFMGADWDQDKVLKPGGWALVWALPRTSHWTATAWENAGFEVRDRIAHCFGTGFPKSLNVGKTMDKYLKTGNASWNGTGDSSNGALGYSKLQHEHGYRPGDYSNKHQNKSEITEEKAKEWDGWGTSLKPAIEDWWVFRKPISEGTVVANVLRYGTGALNIDNCRVEGEAVTINRLEEWSGFGQKKNPDYDSETNTAGRWPANLVHDGSDEVTRLFPVNEHPSGIASGPTRGKMGTRGTFGSANGDMDESKFYGDTGSAARFFKCCPMDDPEDEQAQSLIYCAKASQADRNEGLEGLQKIEYKTHGETGADKSGNSHNTTGQRPARAENFHPTVKATSLMRWLCRLVTRPGGVVLDPFTGSGSTGKGAILEGFDFMGSEKDPDYFQIAKARIEFACGNQSQATVTGTAEPAAILAAQRSQKQLRVLQPGLF